MTLAAGDRLGPYEIVAPIGAGGMGEVFKARDTRLERVVAIKILPPEFAKDEHLRLRFEREARTISKLNHANICGVYDVGHDNGVDYLVLEYLEGESLADRIAKGPLPIAQVLRYGVQIAEALDRAHHAGIVHRDLKPGNVMITKSGAKLLDFGLAKSASTAAPSQVSATEQKPLTEEGAILGTVQYMAPEQLEGLEADARTDIFAFGQVLYEMATGKRAFIGKTRTSLVAAIVAAQPERISSLQPLAPASFEAVVARAMEKDPNDRWQCAADLRWELQRIERELGAGAEAKAKASRSALPWIVAAIALIAAAGMTMVALRPRPQTPVFRFNFEVPQGWVAITDLRPGPPAISPDGRTVAFVAMEAATGRRMLWLRRIEAVDPVMVEGTDDASRPFWSPDSRSVAFFADSKLKRLELAGGPAQAICDAPNSRGGAWGPDGTIVFTPTPKDPLFRVPAGGGTPVAVTTIDAKSFESSHRWPSFLPDGKHFLYIVRRVVPGTSEFPRDRVYVGSLDSFDRKLIMEVSSNIVYCEPGYVMFVRDRTLFAQRFDIKALTRIGDPKPIASPIGFHAAGFGMFTASNAGAIAYQGPSPASRLEWLERGTGAITAAIDARATYATPRISSDGQEILFSLQDATSGWEDIWLYDLPRRIARRLTNNPTDEFSGVLSHDGKQLYFSSNRTGTPQLYVKPVDGGDEKVLVQSQLAEFTQSVSRDGRILIFTEFASTTDIVAQSLTDGKRFPVAASRFDEIEPTLSPDGKSVAFVSNESGRFEVYVVPFPQLSPRVQISADGGMQPAWRGDGREIFYVGTAGRLTAVSIDPGPPIKAGAPSFIGTITLRPSRNANREYDVSGDGRRFLLNSTDAVRMSPPFTVLSNWTAQLPR